MPSIRESGIIEVAGQRYARWYDDGPHPTRFDGSDPAEVEAAYRRAFVESARLAATWGEPDGAAAEDAWEARCREKEHATVLVPSADYFGVTDTEERARLHGEQVVYRVGHAIAAAAARGRHQALATTVDAWERLCARGLADHHIAALLPAWLAEVNTWAASSPAALRCPPVLDDIKAAPAAEPVPVTQTVEDHPFLTARQLLAACPALRPRVIERLLRQGETMNLIAPPKTGKSWLVTDLAIAVATGRPWLGRFPTEAGDVLILDNELHGETSANRIPKVAKARGVGLDEFGDRLCVRNMRGCLQDIVTLDPYFRALEPGRFRLIVLDAFYRFLPAGMDENANADMAMFYNHIDRYASDLRCSFVLIHHSTKGNQSAKAVTDVGAGAGSQSRATDTHLVMRQHEEDGVVVLGAAVRSWPPIEPVCLRWDFPVWDVADDLDPTHLKGEGSRRRARGAPEGAAAAGGWSPERFAQAFVATEPRSKPEIRAVAAGEGLSWRRVADLIDIAESRGLIHRWRVGRAHRVMYALTPQPAGGEAS
jgi:hypothetical protein